MSLTLHFHPLSSFSMKVLVALYESGTPFERRVVDLLSDTAFAAFRKIWPIGKIPVLRDEAKDLTVAETSIIIEYLAQHHPGNARLIPAQPDLAREVRFHDRFFDLYVNAPMQKIVTDKLRPAGQNDSYGVEEARKLLRTACDMVDAHMRDRTWAVGDTFTMADCAAAPGLFYADKVMPLSDGHRHAARYLDRLKARPSFARVIQEAEPYFSMFPG